MITLSINNDKLKVKYLLGNYKKLESFPDSDDLMYFLIQWAMASGKESPTFTNEWLSKQTEKDISIVNPLLIELVDKGYIEQTRKSKERLSYKILLNPYA